MTSQDAHCAQILLEYDPRIISIADLDGKTALHMACAESNINMVMMLTNNNQCDLNTSDLMKQTPLHWAAISGHHHLVHILLDRGASDGIRDVTGATALHLACSKNHSQCVATLLNRPTCSYLPDDYGRYALTWAVSKGHVQTVRVLLAAGVNTRLMDSQNCTGKKYDI